MSLDNSERNDTNDNPGVRAKELYWDCREGTLDEDRIYHGFRQTLGSYWFADIEEDFLDLKRQFGEATTGSLYLDLMKCVKDEEGEKLLQLLFCPEG